MAAEMRDAPGAESTHKEPLTTLICTGMGKDP